MRSPAAPTAALAALTLLAACEVRRDGSAEPSPSPTESEALSPNGEEQAERASIIRPEASPSPEPDEPPASLAATVPFPDGGYELSPAAREVLRGIANSEQAAAGWPIVVRGHTDSEGSDQGNIFASRKRAEAVAGWLVEQGVDEDRVEVIALGEQRPIAPNAHLDGTPDEQGRRLNRRVEIWIGPPGSQPSGRTAPRTHESTEGA